MIGFLFWNLADNVETIPYLVQIGLTYTVDVFLLAECPNDAAGITQGLNALNRGIYQTPSIDRTKVRVVTRLPPGALTARFTNVAGDMTIWRLGNTALGRVLVAVVHLPAKTGGSTDADQQGWAQLISREIAEIEGNEGCEETILVGDLNMNPFDPGMVNVMGLHGLMTQALARKPHRSHRGKEYKRFYNPMWGLFGDRTPGPAGTYYWRSSVPGNQHWYVFDQVLLRPSLMSRFRGVQVLDTMGAYSFMKDGIPTKNHLSDHLPILFQLDL